MLETLCSLRPKLPGGAEGDKQTRNVPKRIGVGNDTRRPSAEFIGYRRRKFLGGRNCYRAENLFMTTVTSQIRQAGPNMLANSWFGRRLKIGEQSSRIV